jgi:hypothetical protein
MMHRNQQIFVNIEESQYCNQLPCSYELSLFFITKMIRMVDFKQIQRQIVPMFIIFK